MILIDQDNKSHSSQYRRWHRLVHVVGSGVPPGSSAIESRLPGTILHQSMSAEFLEPGPWPLPLLPQNASQLPSNPLVQVFKDSLHLRQPEVGNPAARCAAEFLHHVRKAPSAAPSKRLSKLVLEAFHRLRGDLQFRLAVPRDTVAEELAPPRAIHRALVTIDREPQPLSQESLQRSQHPVPRRL